MALIHSESDGFVRTVHFDQPQIADESTIRQVQSELVQVLEESQEDHILLDFGEVTLLSSSALGMLIRVHKKSKEFRKAMRLCTFGPETEQMLRVTGLSMVFDLHRDAGDAIAAIWRRCLETRAEGDTFRFVPELFRCRNQVMAALRKHGFGWVSHHYSVTPLHDCYGIEVGGIRYKRDAMKIRGILKRLFPQWKIGNPWYYQYRSEPGWVVSARRDEEPPAAPG